MRDLLLILVGPLAADLEGDPTEVVEIRQPGLGLEVGVFLEGELVGSLDDDVGLGERGIDIALEDLVPVIAVAA